MRFTIPLFILIGLILVSGCSVPLKHPTTLAYGLSYLDKTGVKGNKFAQSIRLEPGMRLSISALPQLARRRNVIMPAPATFVWVLPEDERYGHADFFAIASLLAFADTRAEVGGPRDPLLCFRKIGDALKTTPGLDADAFFQTYAKTVIGPAVESLRLVYQGRSDRTPGTAGWYRALADEGRAINFMAQVDQNTPSILEFEVALPPGGCDPNVRESIQVFNTSSDVFQTREPTRFSGLFGFPNIWLGRGAGNTGPYAARSMLSVEVPITLNGQPGRHYVPFHFSISDLEDYLGIEVRGLARRASLFPAAKHVGTDDQRIEKARPSDGKRFEVWFGQVGFERTVKRPINTDASNKELILVAGGDLIFWEPRND